MVCATAMQLQVDVMLSCDAIVLHRWQGVLLQSLPCCAYF
jgi:hypothetical protein